MSPIMYSLVKVLHLGAFLLWLGPALGSWLVLRYIRQQQGETSPATLLVYRVFVWTLTLEHLAFFGLLLSGFWMAWAAPWFEMPWIWHKLGLVLLIILPLEIIDIWLGNWVVPKIVRLQADGLPLNARQAQLLHWYHHGFTRLALLILPPTVLLIMWLAVSKQPLGFG